MNFFFLILDVNSLNFVSCTVHLFLCNYVIIYSRIFLSFWRGIFLRPEFLMVNEDGISHSNS